MSSKPQTKPKNDVRLKKYLNRLKLTAKGWVHLQQSGGQKQKGKRKETWSSMRFDRMKIPEGSRRQFSILNREWTNWDNALQNFLTLSDIWHMASLGISFLIRSVYNLLPSNASLVRWGKKEDPTCPLCNGRQTTEHVLRS